MKQDEFSINQVSPKKDEYKHFKNKLPSKITPGTISRVGKKLIIRFSLTYNHHAKFQIRIAFIDKTPQSPSMPMRKTKQEAWKKKCAR